MKDYVITKNGEHCKNLGFDSIEGIYLTIETERDLRKRFPNEVWSHEEYIEEKHGKTINTSEIKVTKVAENNRNFMSEILEKYKDKKPMDLKTAVERVYPISAMIDGMIEFHQAKKEILLEEISNWLMANTSLEVEKIVDLKMKFVN